MDDRISINKQIKLRQSITNRFVMQSTSQGVIQE